MRVRFRVVAPERGHLRRGSEGRTVGRRTEDEDEDEDEEDEENKEDEDEAEQAGTVQP